VVLSLVILLAVFADHVPPVFLVIALFFCCAGQAVLAQQEIFIPKIATVQP